MALTRDAWYKHLLDGTGPLDSEAIESLEPKPALLKLLRELITLPWPEHEDPEREEENDAPFYALLLLGLLRDEKSIDAIRAVLDHGVDEDWDAVVELGPAVLAAIGPAVLPMVLAEIERMERDEMIDAVAIERDGLDESMLYRYWSNVIVVEQIALNHPEVLPEVTRYAAERIASTRFDREPVEQPIAESELFELPTPTEIWVDLQLSLRIPELTPLIESFFERHGAGYRSEIFGTREEYGELMATDAPTGDARARLIETYVALRAPFEEGDEEDEDVEDDTDDADEDGEEDGEKEDDDEDEVVETYVRPTPKVGRNEPCPCGSGKKYKRCHGA